MSAQAPQNAPSQRRRIPRQARSQATVDFILMAAARVFRGHGFAATTNHIAEQAGVSIGTLYEYFPNKGALLFALAERHVATAEAEIGAALSRPATPDPADFLHRLQRAILDCQRYPSQAIDHVERAETAADLRRRALALRQAVLAGLRAFVPGAPDADLRAQAAFAALAELPCRALYDQPDPAAQVRLAELGLDMAMRALLLTR